jgi:hypothetical protein
VRTGGASQFHRATVSLRTPNLVTQPFCFVSIREIDSTVSQLHSPFFGGVGDASTPARCEALRRTQTGMARVTFLVMVGVPVSGGSGLVVPLCAVGA